MKKVFASLGLLFFGLSISAQTPSPYSLKNIRFGVEPLVDVWLKTPSGVKTSWFQRGWASHVLYQYNLGESKYSLIGGLTVSSHNFYSDAILKLTDAGKSYFQALDSKYSYTKNKFSFTYVDIPLEFNYKNDKHISVGLGLKAGVLVNDHTKYAGNDYLTNKSRDIKVKFANNPNVMAYRFAAVANVGFRWINLRATYYLTPLFDKSMGPDMNYLSAGIIIRPY